ncbi:MAG: prephenate dehydrogenase/arogenate dehydrogenase family protein [Thermoanaerobaculia bacterium]
MDLEDARHRIRKLDETILESAARRIELAREVAAIKLSQDLPTVDYRQERKVLDRGREIAQTTGLDPHLADDILSTLMSASVTAQEAQRLRFAAAGKGKSAIVVGGAGRMGRWMVSFLRAQEFRVAVLDPRSPGGIDEATRSRLTEVELVVSAAPPSRTAELYRDWCSAPPSGIVCDMASIKTPMVEAIRNLQARGVRVSSFHPLFGPTTTSLRDCDVVVCDTGDRGAEDFVSDLFAPTSARLIRIGLDEHDRLMADMLSLAHASTLAFAGARVDGGERSVELHSTTDRGLEKLAATLVRESPEVYFEIQVDNPYSEEAVARLERALGHLRDLIQRRDRNGFAKWMAAAAERLPASPC